MRESFPTSNADSHSAMFQYPGFVVAYESGVDQVARFDASIEIFGDAKTVKVCSDTPFVKGLPTTMIVKETLLDGSYRDSTTRRTYEEPLHARATRGVSMGCRRKVAKNFPD